MLYRKIGKEIEVHLTSSSDKILVLKGAKQRRCLQIWAEQPKTFTDSAHLRHDSVADGKQEKAHCAKDIRDKEGDRFVQYQDEFEYLISSGITLDVHTVSNPRFPLSESVHKNLLKLYLNDVGMLTAQLYRNNLRPVLDDERSANLGAVYESAVAQQLKVNGHRLFYYDNRKKGEVDFLIDDYSSTGILPIKVKSGKDYTTHSALNNLLSTPDYHVHSTIVFANDRVIRQEKNILYMPVYFTMFWIRKENRERWSSNDML